jgi:hypothetical protein
MAPTVPVGEPLSLRVGTTWSWKRGESTDFPVADSWVYTYYLLGLTSTSFAGTNSLPTHDFTVTVTAATTAGISAGVYRWELRASLSGAVYTVDTGSFDVTENASVSATTDHRSANAIMLQRCRDEKFARITGDGSGHDEYTIGTRQIKKLTMAELDKAIAIYAAAVERERFGGHLPPYEVEFVRPS